LYVFPEGNWFSPPTNCSFSAPRLAQDASRLAKGSGVPEHGDPLHEFLLQTGGPAWDHGDQPTNQPTNQAFGKSQASPKTGDPEKGFFLIEYKPVYSPAKE